MLSPIKTKLAEKLSDRAYRARFFRGRAQDELAYQLRAARQKRRLTQPELEKKSGMKQSAISRLEQASYPRWNFQSILCLADAMDLRVRVVLECAEDVIAEYEEGSRQTKYSGNYVSGFQGLGNDVGVESAVPITNPQTAYVQ